MRLLHIGSPSQSRLSRKLTDLHPSDTDGSGVRVFRVVALPEERRLDFLLDSIWVPPKEADEVVLVDDKISAFSNLPQGVRGYYVSGSSSKYAIKHLDKLPLPVRQIAHIDEIIAYESKK